MRFSGTSLLGKHGPVKYVLTNISKLCLGFSLKLYVRTGWASDFVLKQTKIGFPMKFGTFGPLEIGGVGEKQPHDSDHAEYPSKLASSAMSSSPE